MAIWRVLIAPEKEKRQSPKGIYECCLAARLHARIAIMASVAGSKETIKRPNLRGTQESAENKNI